MRALSALLLIAACGGEEPPAAQEPITNPNVDPLCAETPPGEDPRQILRFEGDDTEIVLTRDITGLGGGRTWIFEPRRFTMVRNGESTCITDPALLGYEWTHHNWEDVAEATIGGVRWRLSMIRDWQSGDWVDTLERFDAESGAPAGDPIEMDLMEGPRF